jgi:hypothetical protein
MRRLILDGQGQYLSFRLRVLPGTLRLIRSCRRKPQNLNRVREAKLLPLFFSEADTIKYYGMYTVKVLIATLMRNAAQSYPLEIRSAFWSAYGC